ncbi:MAG: CoA transferase [Candidatus Tectomicrobia bacterium]|nr:CoA transferase [Candidatus Tectomicrobia bacterium]
MRALEGVRVLDLTRVYAGPYCTMVLADMGAEVIKIERPEIGDDVRRISPFKDNTPGLERSGYFFPLNRNKLGITLNIQHPKGREMLKRMVEKADVLVENYSPRVMKGLGLGYDVLQEINPRLVMCTICGYGHTGPYAMRPGYDGTAQAMGGIASITGYPDGPPTRVGSSIGDCVTGIHAAFGIMCALFVRFTTGRGQWVDLSQQDTVFSILESAVTTYTITGKIPGRLGSRHGNAYPYDIYPCKNGHVFFAAYLDAHWQKTCELFGEPEFAKDPRVDAMFKRAEEGIANNLIRPKIIQWFAPYTKEELFEMFGKIQVSLGSVLNIEECVNDPQLNAREMIVEVEHPVMGKIKIPGVTVKLSDTPGGIDRPAPLLGQHNEEIYLKLLGLSKEELSGLKREEVI